MFVSRFPEKCLQYYRRHDRQKLLQEHQEIFERKEGSIIALLRQTAFYHGTGAYHYTFAKGSKYEGGEAEASYTLPSILTEGLVPQRDIFNEDFRTGSMHSLSLTKNRIYARGYAHLFNWEGYDLLYDYGPRIFWAIPIVWRIILGAMLGAVLHTLTGRWAEQRRVREHYRIALSQWTRSFRKDGKYEGSFLRCLFARSDIVGNFGIIIGIKHNVITPLPIHYPNIGKDEVRTNQTLKPTDFSHIQVPLMHIEKVQTELQLAGVYDIPVIPIEYVALHEYKVGFHKLLGMSKRGSKLYAT